MIKVTEEHLVELSLEIGVPYDELSKLNAMSLLNDKVVIKTLIKRDYKKLRRVGKYKHAHILTAVSDKYKMSRQYVKSAMFQPKSKESFCEKCGKNISVAESRRGGGLCDECFAKDIDI